MIVGLGAGEVALLYEQPPRGVVHDGDDDHAVCRDLDRHGDERQDGHDRQQAGGEASQRHDRHRIHERSQAVAGYLTGL